MDKKDLSFMQFDFLFSPWGHPSPVPGIAPRRLSPYFFLLKGGFFDIKKGGIIPCRKFFQFFLKYNDDVNKEKILPRNLKN